jgi:hypothetical protein
MDVGTGIFLGLFTIAVVILYLKTRERWNWRKIVLRPVIALVVVGGLGTVAFSAFDKYQQRPKLITEFFGLKLTDSLDDVKFKRGLSKSIKEDYWSYDLAEGGMLTVKFKGSKITSLFFTGDCSLCDNLNGVHMGSAYADVIERLGEPSFVSTSDDGLMRILSFKKTNQMFIFAEGKVIGHGIYLVSNGAVKFNKASLK